MSKSRLDARVFRIAAVFRIVAAFWIVVALTALACSDDPAEPGPAEPAIPEPTEPTDPGPPDSIVIPPRSASPPRRMSSRRATPSPGRCSPP